MSEPKFKRLICQAKEENIMCGQTTTFTPDERGMAEMLLYSSSGDNLTMPPVLANDTLTARVNFNGSIWHINVLMSQEDSVWLGQSTAVSEKTDDAELCSLRYGTTPEEAARASLCTLREAVIAFEQRRKSDK